jgi:siroheme synthase-like protein
MKADRTPRNAPKHAVFPAALLLEGRRCLVVGGGRVAFRKATKLVEVGAAVHVVAPVLDERLESLPGVVLSRRPFAPEDLDGVFLAFATTDAPAVNRHVLDLCREQRILCSASDAHWPEGDLILPASFTEDGLTVSISTSGLSCRRSRRLRESLSRHVRFLRDADLLMIGVDQAANDVQALESLKSARAEIEALLDSLWGVHEFMVLDTCNRFEAVAIVSASCIPPVAALLRRIAGAQAPVHVATGLAAFQRLAEVAAGLRAQALGETRIVAQLKETLAEALRLGFAGSGLQGWTDTALHLSKAIRQAAEPHLAARETEDLVAHHLASRGLLRERLLIVGRGEIGQGLARRFPAALQLSGRSDDDLRSRLPHVDVLVCATGSTSYVLDETHRPLLRPAAVLIDLSVPRNIDPSLPGVVGLSELRASLPEASGEALADAVRTIVAEHVAEYERLVNP